LDFAGLGTAGEIEGDRTRSGLIGVVGFSQKQTRDGSSRSTGKDTLLQVFFTPV